MGLALFSKTEPREGDPVTVTPLPPRKFDHVMRWKPSMKGQDMVDALEAAGFGSRSTSALS